MTAPSLRKPGFEGSDHRLECDPAFTRLIRFLAPNDWAEWERHDDGKTPETEAPMSELVRFTRQPRSARWEHWKERAFCCNVTAMTEDFGMNEEPTSEESDRDRPANKATMDQPQEEFIAPESSHVEYDKEHGAEVAPQPEANK